MNPGDHLWIERERVAAALCIDPLERRTEAREVVGNPLRRIQIAGLERTHEGPAPAEPVADRTIDIVRAGHPIPHEAIGLGHQRPLQAVQHEAMDLAPDFDRRLADGRHERQRAQHDVRPREWRAGNLDEGDEVRRVDGMGDDHTVAPRQRISNLRRGERGGGTGQDRLPVRRRIERCEQFALRRQGFGDRLLDVVGARDGRREALAHVHLRE